MATCFTCGTTAHTGPETGTFRHTKDGSHADAPPDRTDLDTRKRCTRLFTGVPPTTDELEAARTKRGGRHGSKN